LTWFVLTASLLIIFVAGLRPRFDELVTICQAEPCIALTLLPDDVTVLESLGLSIEFYAGYHVGIEIFSATVISLLGGLIFWRRFQDGMGILVAFALVLFGASFMVEADSALMKLYPTFQPGLNLLNALSGVPFVLLFYLFPDGRFVPRWTYWPAAALTITALADPLLQKTGSRITSGIFSSVLLAVFLVCLLVGVFAQVYRYRHISNPIERQQTKWVVFGLTGLFFVVLIWSLFVEIAPPRPGYPRMLFNLVIHTFAFGLFMLFPVTVVISILRYRLWDIDLVIRRTLMYGMLTGLLAIVYFGSVLVTQTIFQIFTGRTENSQLTIVLSTLVIAALFNPLRRRVQMLINRRFYRQNYDAALTLAHFAATARDEVDLTNLTHELVRVVDKTMRPAHISLWLRENEPEGDP
jgi:hypothetical protein